jgi:hypothetical protein
VRRCAVGLEKCEGSKNEQKMTGKALKTVEFTGQIDNRCSTIAPELIHCNLSRQGISKEKIYRISMRYKNSVDKPYS